MGFFSNKVDKVKWSYVKNRVKNKTNEIKKKIDEKEEEIRDLEKKDKYDVKIEKIKIQLEEAKQDMIKAIISSKELFEIEDDDGSEITEEKLQNKSISEVKRIMISVVDEMEKII